MAASNLDHYLETESNLTHGLFQLVILELRKLMPEEDWPEFEEKVKALYNMAGATLRDAMSAPTGPKLFLPDPPS